MIRLGLLICIIAMAGCSSNPNTGATSGPEWIHQSTRNFDNGYIVYVGTGDDTSGDRAQFKAESAALEDLANECSFVPKGARLEDRFERTEGNLHEAYAKVAVEFQLCEDAKKAIAPDQVKRLANETMTAQIKKYQDMQGDQTTAETLASIGDEAEGETEISAPSTPSTPTPVRSNPNFRFFVIRQQVAVEKQTVILAPTTVYEPGTAASAGYMTRVAAASQRVEQIQAARPEIKQTNQGWSAQQHHVRELVRQRDPRPSMKTPAARSFQPQKNRQGSKPNRRKYRRR